MDAWYWALEFQLMTVRMLYEFHRAQNRRKPGSVHATYLVTGIQKPDDQKAVSGNADGDVAMKDDSEMSSSMPQPDEGDAESQEPVPTTAITLVQEEHLEGSSLAAISGTQGAELLTDS